jgi:hypothetical protein
MRRKRFFRSWLLAPPLSGKLAIAFSIVAVALPTLIRHALDGQGMEVDFVPYCPFVLVAAILMSWRYATFVALGSALTCDYLFMGPPSRLLETEIDWFAIGIFFFYCALVIGLVQIVRKMVETYPRRADPNEESSGIIGPCDEVAEMMEDFLAQVELGKRLTAKVAVRR